MTTLETALAEIAALSADLRVWRSAADTLREQLDAVKEIAAHRAAELAAAKEANRGLVKYHRDFIISLMREKCAAAPAEVTIENTLYEGLECDVIVGLERFIDTQATPGKRSLMFKTTRVYPISEGAA